MSGGLAAGVCLVCFIKLFTLPKEPPPPKRKAKGKRKHGRKVQPRKVAAKPEKPKKAKKHKPYKAPELSPEQQAIFARYQAGRMGIKYDQW